MFNRPELRLKKKLFNISIYKVFIRISKFNYKKKFFSLIFSIKKSYLIFREKKKVKKCCNLFLYNKIHKKKHLTNNPHYKLRLHEYSLKKHH